MINENFMSNLCVINKQPISENCKNSVRFKSYILRSTLIFIQNVNFKLVVYRKHFPVPKIKPKDTSNKDRSGPSTLKIKNEKKNYKQKVLNSIQFFVILSPRNVEKMERALATENTKLLCSDPNLFFIIIARSFIRGSNFHVHFFFRRHKTFGRRIFYVF